MNKDLSTALREEILGLVSTQRLGVIATHGAAHLHCSLVGIDVSRDLKSMLFATPRTTRKYENISTNDRVSVLVDNRSNTPEDFRNAMAVTVWGKAEEYPKNPDGRLLRAYLKKHPYLREFVFSPQCALMRIRVERYILVRRFQEVLELRP